MTTVLLQVNERDSRPMGWRNVMQFDAAHMDHVKAHVAQLHEAAPTTRWRIATCDKLPMVLRYLGDNTHGIWIDRGPLT